MPLEAAAATAADFFASVVTNEIRTLHDALRSRRFGVVYAAIGPATIRKASASCLSIEDEDAGKLLATNDQGFEFVRPWVEARGDSFWFDRVVSLDGHGLDFGTVPEFDAFTPRKERIRTSKEASWHHVRILRSAKIAALLAASRIFEFSVFLDADTAACGSLAPAFRAVEETDVAFVPAPNVHHAAILKSLYGIEGPPPEPNSGVFAFSSNARPTLLEWSRVYWRESREISSIQNPMDQPPLRAAMSLQATRWAALNSEFNCRGHARFASFPMRCGGSIPSLARKILADRLRKHSRKVLDYALRAQERKCHVIHSHELPRPRPKANRTNFDLATQRVALLDLFAADDEASPFDACPSCAIVLLAEDPWHRFLREGARAAKTLAARGATALDFLIPLWPHDLRFAPPGPERAPLRADRVRRLGEANWADLLDVVHRLPTEVALVLLPSRHAESSALIAARFARRPGVARRLQARLDRAAAERPPAPTLRNETRLLRWMRLDVHLYRALEHRFEAQLLL
ncbi:hypothetical protein CTAYLR_006714 [Chrysophaeum taylorii]|uniref:Nucleotide-diphospho-sugar transferase domain-containing protein n=1 Tax=Chrysophaeum taylorii TaxID=2483200 RepID=A0AAD7UC03_9STRA|nr:hypothetical protein CTAYLR_006714 [Chrysophaeum taylorii]